MENSRASLRAVPAVSGEVGPDRGASLVRLHPRPDTVHVSRGRTVLATGRDGFVTGGEQGLFVHETRMLSRYLWRVDREPLVPVALSNVEQHSWLGYYVHAPAVVREGPKDEGSGMLEALSERTLGLQLSRSIGEGLHEDVELENHTGMRLSLELELEIGADFADLAEIQGDRRIRGRARRRWTTLPDGGRGLEIDWNAVHEYSHQEHQGEARASRGLRMRFEGGAASPDRVSFPNGKLARAVFRIELAPGGTWHGCVRAFGIVEGRALDLTYPCRCFGTSDVRDDGSHERFLEESTRFEDPSSGTLASVVLGGLERARQDLAALRLHDLDAGERSWVAAAGLPIYVAYFGRDTLTVGLQAAMLGHDMMHGSLVAAARLQGKRHDDWRDEQPGRMPHEAHTGPLAVLKVNPRERYYGSATTSAFYPVVLSELWHWTGDRELVRPLLEPTLDALEWLDRYGDLDGDGFYEYRTRSEQGVVNQGWKDSGDAIVREDGSHVEPPIATCEEQGFVYLAKLHMSELLTWLGEHELARRLFREARELRERFHEAFWMEEEGFYALGLDAKKRPIRAITSNPGFCLSTGIADRSVCRRVADRLLEEDLFSGWGIRTLSTRNPAYNPYSYHRGSVWPVEQASCALGFMRYGLHEHLERLCRAQFEALSLFDLYRFPEVFSGHARAAAHPFPALYPKTNWPQAWSSSSVYWLVQSLLGLYPYAPLHLLLVDPHLPAWLPEITLRGMRVGEATIDLRFHRQPSGRTDYEVLEKQGALHVVRQPSPWSLSATSIERVMDLLRSLVPSSPS